jgi:hypothetical protein
MKVFTTAIELAKYIKSLDVSELEEEQMMAKAVQYKKVNGVYAI